MQATGLQPEVVGAKLLRPAGFFTNMVRGWLVATMPREMPGGAIAFALMSISLGLVWGRVAKTTGSIRWTVVAHILLNLAVPAGRSFI